MTIVEKEKYRCPVCGSWRDLHDIDGIPGDVTDTPFERRTQEIRCGEGRGNGGIDWGEPFEPDVEDYDVMIRRLESALQNVVRERNALTGEAYTPMAPFGSPPPIPHPMGPPCPVGAPGEPGPIMSPWWWNGQQWVWTMPGPPTCPPPPFPPYPGG